MNNNFTDASYSQADEEFLSSINNLFQSYYTFTNPVSNTYPQFFDVSFNDLSYSDLSFNDLSYSDLSVNDLSYSDLSFNDLSYSDLPEYNLNYPSNFNFETIFRNTIQNRFNAEVSSIQSMEEEPEYKLLLKEDMVSNLKNTSYKNSQKNNECCPILMTSFQEDDEVIELDCKHCFDKDAIIYWLTKENAVCPVCRFQFPEEFIQKEVIHKKPLSRTQIEDFVRNRYVNELTRNLSRAYENETEIAMQRILLESYSTPDDASNNS